MILDKWQEEVLKTKGNIALTAPRQVGKSTIIAKKAADFIKNNSHSYLFMINPGQALTKVTLETDLSRS